jgi:AraC family transcriptional regulator of adaptative response / DNA-3-methyladenine glycosylase II
MAYCFCSKLLFNCDIRRTYSRTPTELRRLRRRPQGDSGSYRFTLSYRPPYDWDALIGFLATRATPGVEAVDRSGYRRTIALGGKAGWMAVTRNPDAPSLLVDVTFPDPNLLLVIVERARRMFDVGADPAAIAEHLGIDRQLRRAWLAHPGLRVPGAWDGFELTVRAILGQQISVRAATTVAGRIAARWGTPVAAGGLDRLFPTPAQLADAPIEEAGVIGARARSIRALAKAVVDGTLAFDAPGCLDGLRALPGVGEWTAQYVAMRALNEPDAFLSGDLVLRRMAGDCSARELDARSERWRPWRAYAVLALWQAATDAGHPARHRNTEIQKHRRPSLDPPRSVRRFRASALP